jgi:hypothetical protein
VAGVSSLTAGKALADATPVDLFDDRKRVKGTGYDLIYEARDLDLPQNVRDGITQFRGDLTATKARFQESSKRIEGQLGTYINKSYWCVLRHIQSPSHYSYSEHCSLLLAPLTCSMQASLTCVAVQD